MKNSGRKLSLRRRVVGAVAAALAGVSLGAEPALAQKGAAIVDLGGESDTSRSIVLPLNKAAIVNLPRPAADVLVSQPSVVDAVVRSSRRVYLLGLDVGLTNAFFFDDQGRQILNLEIQVERDVDALNDLLARLMPDSRITAEAINDTIILRGSVRSSAQAANAADIAARFIEDENNVIPMMTIRQREQVMLKVRIVEMQRSILKQLGVDVNGVAALTNASINAAAATIGAGVAASGASFELLRNIGTNGSNIGLTFQALEQVGLVKTLAEPTLTAVSGEAANFLAGGEFPIPINQRDDVITIEFKQFGVGLGFTPLVLDKGRINIKVSTEVSEVTSANNFSLSGQTVTLPGTPATPAPPDQFQVVDTDADGIPDQVVNITSIAADEVASIPVIGDAVARPQGTPAGEPTIINTTGLTIPAFTVRRAETTVELPSGGSLVMAGLLQENMRQTMNGIPGLLDVPILGQLFRSREYENAETELAIIATPYIVGPTHESKLTDPSKGFITATDAQSILMGKLTSTYGLAGSGVEEKTLQGPIGFILD
ncbi:MAG: type II and III secretion system protein family protein [Pseudomonadota bacterium]